MKLRSIFCTFFNSAMRVGTFLCPIRVSYFLSRL